MTRIADNTFAAACYDMNTIADLRAMLAGEPDETDMQTWGITADQWRDEIKLAIAVMEEDGVGA